MISAYISHREIRHLSGTPEEILESGRKMYSEMSDETRDFFNMMMENELFDVFGRKNKATGGYMTELPDYGVPFIFANFNGTSGDVDVITHECGHAFQNYVSGKDPITDHSPLSDHGNCRNPFHVHGILCRAMDRTVLRRKRR